MSNGTPSTKALENDIAAVRDRLAQTIDELAVRVEPKNVVNRQKEQARASFYSATHSDSGEVRMDRVAIAGAVVLGLVVLKVLSDRSKRRW